MWNAKWKIQINDSTEIFTEVKSTSNNFGQFLTQVLQIWMKKRLKIVWDNSMRRKVYD